MRSHRVATVAWVLGGSLAMYLIAIALADEMASFPGGPKAFSESLRAGIEAMRPLRWPADRLDTLGGYLTYHNLTLITLFLSLYAGVQGARAIRGQEEAHSLEEVLAAGSSRATVLRGRALGFALTLVVITLGLGVGVALSMAAGHAPDLGGSLITMTASGLCALVGYSSGLLASQVTGTSRAAGGLTALLLALLYVTTNVWEDLGPFGLVRFVSPFYYANASRALVPGYGLDIGATAALVAMSAVLLALSAWAFQCRDYGAALWSRPPRRRRARAARVQRPMLRTTWAANLLRGRLGLLAWCAGTAAYTALLASLQPSVMEAWSAFGSWVSVAGGGPGVPPAAQYLSLVGEILTIVVAAYVVTQASGWVADLDQGRVEVVLAAPVSWTRLVWERLLGVTLGVCVITAAALAGFAVAGAAVGAQVDAAGLARTAGSCVLLGAAIGSVAAVTVAAFRSGIAVTVLAMFLGVSYLVGILVPLLGWPEWVNRLSVFGAFGHPYLAWPPLTGTLVLLVLAVPGGILAAAIAERTPKVA